MALAVRSAFFSSKPIFFDPCETIECSRKNKSQWIFGLKQKKYATKNQGFRV